MTNELYPFLAVLKTTLQGLSSFKRVDWYPYDLDLARTDGNSPSLLIEEGDEELADLELNSALCKNIRVSIWLYLDTRKVQTKTITDLQSEVETAVLSDSFLSSSGAYCISWNSVEKGDHLEDEPKYEVGYNNSKIVRKINFDVTLSIGRD